MAQGNVEVWLGSLLRGSLESVHAVVHQAFVAISDPNLALIDFLNSSPAQVATRVYYLNSSLK